MSGSRITDSFFDLFEEITLTKTGVWLSNGEEITHMGTQLGFSKNIFRCPDGFELRLGHERKTIHVEDTIYFVVALIGSGEVGYELKLNDGRTLPMDPHKLRYQPGRLTLRVPHPNDGTQEEARFLSTAYYELLKNLESDDEGFKVKIKNEIILLAKH